MIIISGKIVGLYSNFQIVGFVLILSFNVFVENVVNQLFY